LTIDSGLISFLKVCWFVVCSSIIVLFIQTGVSLFVVDLPSDWQPLLKNVVCTQTFSQFVDDRVLFSKLDKGMCHQYLFLCLFFLVLFYLIFTFH